MLKNNYATEAIFSKEKLTPDQVLANIATKISKMSYKKAKMKLHDLERSIPTLNSNIRAIQTQAASLTKGSIIKSEYIKNVKPLVAEIRKDVSSFSKIFGDGSSITSKDVQNFTKFVSAYRRLLQVRIKVLESSMKAKESNVEEEEIYDELEGEINSTDGSALDVPPEEDPESEETEKVIIAEESAKKMYRTFKKALEQSLEEARVETLDGLEEEQGDIDPRPEDHDDENYRDEEEDILNDEDDVPDDDDYIKSDDDDVSDEEDLPSEDSDEMTDDEVAESFMYLMSKKSRRMRRATESDEEDDDEDDSDDDDDDEEEMTDEEVEEEAEKVEAASEAYYAAFQKAVQKDLNIIKKRKK